MVGTRLIRPESEVHPPFSTLMAPGNKCRGFDGSHETPFQTERGVRPECRCSDLNRNSPVLSRCRNLPVKTTAQFHDF